MVEEKNFRILHLAEPYSEGDMVGFVVPYDNGKIVVKSSAQWSDQNDKLGEALAHRGTKVFWPWPARPPVDEEDLDLLKDLVAVIHEAVDLHSPDAEVALAVWVIASWIAEEGAVCPRLILRGPTKSGKGRVIALVHLLGYRGKDLGDPTPATIFRLAEWFRPTVAIDEFQDLPPEQRAALLALFKFGFDGTPIPRMNDRNTDVEFFSTKAFMAISVKDWLPPEDYLNRSLVFTMMKNARPVGPRPKDNDKMASLRARLLAFRMKVLSGRYDMDELHQRAATAVSEPFNVEGKELILQDRAAEIAEVLLLPALLFGGVEEVRRIIASSEVEGYQQMRETFVAQVFFALQMVVNESRGHDIENFAERVAGRIYAIDIKRQLQDDLRTQGNIGEKDEIPTRKVTNALKTLNFKIHQGAQNRSYIDPDTFERIYHINLEKYGKRADG